MSYTYTYCLWNSPLTQVVQPVAGLVQGSGVELEADDGEDDDREEQEKGDVDQGTDGLPDGAHHNLETWRKKRKEIFVHVKGVFDQREILPAFPYTTRVHVSPLFICFLGPPPPLM